MSGGDTGTESCSEHYGMLVIVLFFQRPRFWDKHCYWSIGKIFNNAPSNYKGGEIAGPPTN